MSNPYQRLDGPAAQYPQQGGYDPYQAPPAYPGGGYQQPYPQQPYPQQPYQQQPYQQQPYQQQPPPYGAPTYAQPPAAPIVVNVTNTQQQSAPVARPTVVVQPRTVFLGRNYDNDVGPALIIFIIGFFCWCVWAAGFRYVRSKNCAAKTLGILSVFMFFAGIVLAVTWVVIILTDDNNDGGMRHGGTGPTYTTTYTLFASSNMPNGYYPVMVPSGYSQATVVSSTGRTWEAMTVGSYTDANGYVGQSCGVGCPMPSQNLMALVGYCDSDNPTLVGTYSTSFDIDDCFYLNLAYNDLSTNSHYGSISVTVTWSM